MRVQDRFTGNGSSRQLRSAENPDFSLRVFVRCEACGKGLTGSTSNGNGGLYSYYRCRVHGCRAVKFKRDDLHAMFVELLYSLAPEPAFMPLVDVILKDGLVFTGITPGQVSVAFARLCRSQKLLDFRFHDLRHTAASWLRMRGADIHTVAQLLGHKDLRMAARYQHLSPQFLGMP